MPTITKAATQHASITWIARHRLTTHSWRGNRMRSCSCCACASAAASWPRITYIPRKHGMESAGLLCNVVNAQPTHEMRQGLAAAFCSLINCIISFIRILAYHEIPWVIFISNTKLSQPSKVQSFWGSTKTSPLLSWVWGSVRYSLGSR